jgi:hypothetical protein
LRIHAGAGPITNVVPGMSQTRQSSGGGVCSGRRQNCHSKRSSRSFSSFIAAIVAAHSSGGSKASDSANDKLSDIRHNLDLAVVVVLGDEHAEVAAEIDQSGALVVELEFDALDSARIRAAALVILTAGPHLPVYRRVPPNTPN